MNLELADYQHSLQALEEKLSGAQGELEQARGEGREQQAKMDALRKEIGEQEWRSFTHTTHYTLHTTHHTPHTTHYTLTHSVQTHRPSSVLLWRIGSQRRRHCG